MRVEFTRPSEFPPVHSATSPWVQTPCLFGAFLFVRKQNTGASYLRRHCSISDLGICAGSLQACFVVTRLDFPVLRYRGQRSRMLRGRWGQWASTLFRHVHGYVCVLLMVGNLSLITKRTAYFVPTGSRLCQFQRCIVIGGPSWPFAQLIADVEASDTEIRRYMLDRRMNSATS